ncbi:hypothetical protein QCD80_00385 [Pseudomonas syringae pv. actinidiae]|uniref:hypothetical protein n=1 Tax=Pseudomonas syringae TaxID=317 RepID=UPI002436A020|nr:hypothetical protein [Pseudomonas syringae]MDG6431952.1 hypothetical protein [Pseudomonas syringae pv. actinidiae]
MNMINFYLSRARFANERLDFISHMKVSSPLLFANLISSTQAFVLLAISISLLSHQAIIFTYAASIGLFYTSMVLAVTNPVGYRVSSHVAKKDHRAALITIARAYPYLLILIGILWLALVYCHAYTIKPISASVDLAVSAQYMKIYWADSAILTLSVPLYLLALALKKNLLILMIAIFGAVVTLVYAFYQVFILHAQIPSLAAASLYGRIVMALAYAIIFLTYLKSVWHDLTVDANRSDEKSKNLFSDIVDYVSASLASNGLSLTQALVLSLTPTILIVSAAVSSVSNIFNSLGLALGTSGGIALARANAIGEPYCLEVSEAIKIYAKIFTIIVFLCGLVILIVQLGLTKYFDGLKLIYISVVTSLIVCTAFFTSYTSKAILRGDARFQKNLTFRFVKFRAVALVFFYALTLSDMLTEVVYFSLMLLMAFYYALAISKRIDSGLWVEKFKRI